MYDHLVPMIPPSKSPVYTDYVCCYHEDSSPHLRRYQIDTYPAFEGRRETHQLDLSDFSSHSTKSSSRWTIPSLILPLPHNNHQSPDPHLIRQPDYPSPPPTSSQPGRSVPLPNLCCNTSGLSLVEQSSTSESPFGGILDSPPVMKHEMLKSQVPLSPPPTLPTFTMSLPLPDHDPAPSRETSRDFNLDSSPNMILAAPDSDDVPRSHLLSPLSPNWEAMRIVAGFPQQTPAQDSFFFSDTSYSVPLLVDNGSTDILSHQSFGFQDGFLPGMWQPSTPSTVDHEPVFCGGSEIPDTISLSYRKSHLPLLYMSRDDEQESDISWSSMSSKTTSFSRPRHLEEQGSWDEDFELGSTSFSYPSSPLLSSPSSSDHEIESNDYDCSPISPPSSPSLRSFSELPIVDDTDDEDFGLEHQDGDSISSSLLEFPSDTSTSSSRMPQQLPKNKNLVGGRGSPIRSFPGVDTDDDLIPADLASLSCIPDRCLVIPSTPYITPSTLIPYSLFSRTSDTVTEPRLQRHGDSLSGTSSNNSLLLFHDDLGSNSDFYNTGRIGAELDLLDPALIASDAELKRLLDMRNRSLASERHARMVEVQYENIRASWCPDGERSTEVGKYDEDFSSIGTEEEREARLQAQQEEARMQAQLAMQAKRTRKREKEKLKEISALVKIRLKDRGVLLEKSSSYPSVGAAKDEEIDMDFKLFGADSFLQENDAEEGDLTNQVRTYSQVKPNKTAITSMPQLVARMFFRRHEARSRPLAKMRPALDFKGPSGSDKTSTPQRGPITKTHRLSPLALSSGDFCELEGITPSREHVDLSDSQHCQPHQSSLQLDMEVDCHTCHEPTISSLDDLEMSPPFNKLRTLSEA
ncbi:hypothetical protein AX17_001892 [Amanita inopinata Kibby_2008]|nr:hypothetical protein AX17_001892 [Amanita inopinata Kibby_2008]